MPTASLVIIALSTALILGGAASAWLWLVREEQWIVAGGLRALAAMRWRESSRFVIEALEAQGFTPSRLTPDAGRGQNADLLLNRGDQTWLLSCKQGIDYRVDAAMVDQLSRSVRDSGADGGILATLGRIQPDALRKHQGIELIDGATLWPLIDPLLPPSLHQDLLKRARKSTLRATAISWLLAAITGIVVATLVARFGDHSDTPAVPAAAPMTVLQRAPDPADLPADADDGPASPPSMIASEADQRSEVERTVSALPGIGRAGWVTRSTLLVQVQADTSDAQVAEICAVLQRHEALRTSRVQLQPPPTSDVPVRFLQCKVF